ncbi:MAG: DUF3048 domain-containing protein [Clostridia bacterium]|nr:DUF3048 domain-containing protein [Clostridia bacterium]NCC43163.1 DUF3048 domain-containing protein [Clostridia bacterium]
MKKYAKLILMLGLAGTMLTGCQKKAADTEATVTATPTPTEEVVVEETPTPEVMAAEEPTPTEDPIPEGQVVSYLTGEYVPEEIGRRRPVAVMLNNVKAACPQAGIANAGVVYEAPVEGGITRLMGVFEDYDNLEKIGSVRSCRDYYIFYASGFNAIYTHYGQSAYALPILDLPEVNNLSGLAGYGDQVFYRTTDRKSPHNAYTSFEGIQKGIEINGYSQEYAEDFVPGYAFCAVDDDIELPGTVDASVVKPGYFLNEPWFEYNPEDKLYYRFQYGEPHIDQLTGEQIAFKNIILQYSSWRNYDEHGYLNIDVDEPNVGKYIVNGKAIDITWKKHTPWGATYYYDTNGNQITLDTGKTFVCIVQDTYADRVEILGSDSAADTSTEGTSEEQAAAEEAAASETEY